jgi:hypothetical protein
MVKLTRKYKKKNSRSKSMKKHKVSKKGRKSGKQWKKGGMKNTFTPSKNSAFRPISQDDIETGKTGISKNTRNPNVSSFSLDQYDVESATPIQQGTPIPPSFSRTNTPKINNTLNLLNELPPPPYPQPSPRNTNTPVVFQKVKSSIFIPGEEQKKISSENLLKYEIANEPEIIYEKKQYNDYVKNYPMGKNIPPPLRYDDYIKEILLPEKGIKYAKYGIQLYTLPNTNRVYDKKGKLFTEEDIKMLEKKYKERPFIDPDDLIVDDKLATLGIYKNKNDPPGSKNIYDKESYLLDQAGLDALLHNYTLQMKKGIRERTSKK